MVPTFVARPEVDFEVELAVVLGRAERDVPVEQIQPGDRIRLRPGEKVPVDGVVVDGGSAIDESMLTGESITSDKSALKKSITLPFPSSPHCRPRTTILFGFIRYPFTHPSP